MPLLVVHQSRCRYRLAGTPGLVHDEFLLVVQQSRCRYRAQRRPASSRNEKEGVWEDLASGIERTPRYRQLLAVLIKHSGQFEQTLSRKQYKRWLKLEDALFAHAWFLHGEFFKAGYQLGKAASSGGSRQAREHRSQAMLLAALGRLLDELTKETTAGRAARQRKRRVAPQKSVWQDRE